MERLYEQAKLDFPVSREALDKIEKLDLYVIQHFRIAFGNRIMKQLKDFVPVSPAAAPRRRPSTTSLLPRFSVSLKASTSP